MKSFLVSTLRLVLFGLVVSLVLTLINIPILLIRGKEIQFWMRFLSGAAVIFVFLFIVTAVKTVIELRRYAKDPVYKSMNLHTGIRWNDYKSIPRKETIGPKLRIGTKVKVPFIYWTVEDGKRVEKAGGTPTTFTVVELSYDKNDIPSFIFEEKDGNRFEKNVNEVEEWFSGLRYAFLEQPDDTVSNP